MSDSITVDAARCLCCWGTASTIAKLWQTFTERAERGLAVGAPAGNACRIQTSSSRDVFSDIYWRRGCPRARPSTASTHHPFHGQPCSCHGAFQWRCLADNILLFAGQAEQGKSHLGAALGHALVENGYRVLLTRTTPCSVCKPPDRRCHWKAPSTSSTSTT